MSDIVFLVAYPPSESGNSMKAQEAADPPGSTHGCYFPTYQAIRDKPKNSIAGVTRSGGTDI
jgi:hypothetical protein